MYNSRESIIKNYQLQSTEFLINDELLNLLIIQDWSCRVKVSDRESILNIFYLFLNYFGRTLRVLTLWIHNFHNVYVSARFTSKFPPTIIYLLLHSRYSLVSKMLRSNNQLRTKMADRRNRNEKRKKQKNQFKRCVFDRCWDFLHLLVCQ